MSAAASDRALRILLVEDNPGDARLLAELLAEAHGTAFSLRTEPTLERGLAARDACDVVLLDLSLPDAQGLDTVRRMIAARDELPVVILTGYDDDELATAAMAAGAQDYLRKGELTPTLVARTVRYAIERKRAEESARRLVLAQVAQARSEEAARRAQFLGDLGAMLASSLDVDETAARTAARVVPTLGDVCAIDVVDGDGALARVASAASANEDATLLRALADVRRVAHASMPQHRAFTERRTVVLADDEDALADAVATSDDERAILRALRPRSVVIAPMIVRDRVIGALTAAFGRSRRPHAPEDVLMVEEVARRAAMALENARLYAEAQRAVRAREDVLAIVSHDLRNPLTIVQMTIQALRRAEDGDARRRELLQHGSRALAHIHALLDDLLDLARLEAGTLRVEPEPVELGPTLGEIVELQRPLAEGKSQQLIFHPLAARPRVEIDRRRFTQVLTNLLANAIKFTPRGGRIDVFVEHGEGEVAISVADSGPGIPQDQIAHVFDRFWQGSHKLQGVGLGLAIAKALIDAHGGSLSCASPPGQGAIFRVALPIVLDVEPAQDARASRVPEIASA